MTTAWISKKVISSAVRRSFNRIGLLAISLNTASITVFQWKECSKHQTFQWSCGSMHASVYLTLRPNENG